jgi:hypothetical protein
MPQVRDLLLMLSNSKQWKSRAAEAALSHQRDMLLTSGLFDADWYLSANPDVRASGMDPAIHYLTHGRYESRAPSPSAEKPRLPKPQISLSTQEFRSQAEFNAAVQKAQDERAVRLNFESALAAKESTFWFYGECSVCGQPRAFLTRLGERDWSRDKAPRFREQLICQQCGCNNRMRMALHLLVEKLQAGHDASIYATEQVTPLFTMLKARFPIAIGSEFLQDACPLGQHDVKGVRNEDVTKLAFADEELDFVVTLEVLEHVPEYRAALAQFSRCLKPGGRLLMTVPFHTWKSDTVVRARVLSDGSVEHLKEPEIHGNPIDQSGGSLCFYHFGWDLLEHIRTSGFSDAYVLGTWSREFAYLGSECLAIVATK